jgi:hypothetical protein
LQILTGDPLARLLLLVHQNLGRARHPRHQHAALGPLHAMLTLLGPRVTAPSTFRYAVTILLRQLHVRWVAGGTVCWAQCPHSMLASFSELLDSA